MYLYSMLLLYLLVVRHLDKVRQQRDGLVHVNLVSRRQTFVELIIDARQDGLNSADSQLIHSA